MYSNSNISTVQQFMKRMDMSKLTKKVYHLAMKHYTTPLDKNSLWMEACTKLLLHPYSNNNDILMMKKF